MSDRGDSPPPRRDDDRPPRRDEDGVKLFVGGLAWAMEDRDLRDAFEVLLYSFRCDEANTFFSRLVQFSTSASLLTAKLADRAGLVLLPLKTITMLRKPFASWIR